MSNKFRPVKGSQLTPEQAQAYGERIEALVEQNNGQITPEIVAQDAKDKKSPLHDYFEWDDATAADKYRVDQGRYLLRMINVVVMRDGVEEEVRAFHNVIVHTPATSERVYTTTARVMSEAELRQQVIDQALKELENWKRKYRQYGELSAYFAALEAVEKPAEVVAG